ncbi:MAG: phosphate ABC transporter permease PstA [Chloroflexi bacterium]|jgi:phosphate transport system permease protein|nr:phosphate ABC transporter permease PstA [Chloroflexota bacterium]
MIDSEYIRRQVEEDNPYPRGEEMQAQIGGRRRRGTAWRWLFLVATVLAIIVLMVLLLTIINQTFGLVAEQVEIPEETLVTNYNKERLLSASNIVESSEDDQSLAEGIGADPLGTGFFGFAFYERNRSSLKALSFDGVAPTLENVQNESYPAVRPLYIYSSQTVIEEKPEAAAFLGYYLQHLDEVVGEAGYFPADSELLIAQEQAIAAAMGIEGLPEIDPSEYSGSIAITGSSTVYPISLAMAERFKADGFDGVVKVSSSGTGGGFDAFCSGNDEFDIVNASRVIETLEFETCSANNLDLAEFRIGTDAVVAVVSGMNDFAADINREQMEQLFTLGVTWADIDPDWPAEEIARYIPSTDSGTMDFFVRNVFDEQSLQDMSYDGLVSTFVGNISAGRCRALEREQKFYENFLICDDPDAYVKACASENPPMGCTSAPRTPQDVEMLIQSEVIKPRILKSWFLYPSLFEREAIALEASQDYPNAEVKYRSWLSWDFISSPQSSTPELAGVRTAILGSLWVVLISIMLAFPLGVAAAIYLEEYASPEKWHNRVIQTNINNLAGVPSIIYGMLGLAVFVRILEPLTSGAIFGLVEAGTTANGRTVLAAGLTLGLLGLPIVIIAAQEAVKAVPPSLREASMGLGATKWQTIWHHVLPNALSGILTGTILTMSRVIGETAPLVVVGASTFITTDPTSPFAKFTSLPAQIFQWTTRPQDTFRNIAGAAIIALLILLLLLNTAAIILRNRFSKQLT